MDKLKFIKDSLEYDLEYWEKAEKEEPNNAFNRGAAASLRALKSKIKRLLEE